MKMKNMMLIIWMICLGCSKEQDGCTPAHFILKNDTCNPDWFSVYDSTGTNEVVHYSDGQISVKQINTNRISNSSEWMPAEKFQDRGAISCFGYAFGGVVTNASEHVQYWLEISIWNNVEDLTPRNVNPSDVVIHSAQEPIIVQTNGEWQIRFKP